MKQSRMSASLAAILLLAAAALPVLAVPPIPAVMLVQEGDSLGGSTVSSLNAAFTDGLGKPGFVGALADGQRFIWHNTGPVFYSGSALPLVLTGGEGTMGVSNAGGFVYSPSVNGNDAVYTHAGELLKKTDPVPALPGLFSSFNSRPSMLPDGTAYWIGGTATTPTGSTSNRHLFRADPTNPAGMTRVLGGGDVIAGKTIKTTATNFDYWISDNGAHHIHVLDMNVTLNEHVYLDGGFVAQEGSPTGQGDNWSSFDVVAVNNAGDYIFTGDTDGVTTSDEFLAVNGAIKIREGDVLDGVTLASGFSLTAASISNAGRIVHTWGSGTNEHLFFGEATNLSASVELLAVGDEIDVNGDLVSDYQITDLNASNVIGPGLDLSSYGNVYVDVDVIPIGGGSAVQAVISLLVPEPGSAGILVLGLVALLRRR